MQQLIFTPEDISLNRQGILSQTQIERVKNHVFFSKKKNIKLWLAFGVIIGIFMVIREVPLNVWPYALVLLSLYPLAHFIQIQLRINKLIKGKIPVQSIRGIVDIFYDEDILKMVSKIGITPAGSMINTTANLAGINSAGFCYCIKVSDKRFYVDEETYNLFEKGKEYIIYYIRTLNTSPGIVIPRGTLAWAIIVSREKVESERTT